MGRTKNLSPPESRAPPRVQRFYPRLQNAPYSSCASRSATPSPRLEAQCSGGSSPHVCFRRDGSLTIERGGSSAPVRMTKMGRDLPRPSPQANEIMRESCQAAKTKIARAGARRRAGDACALFGDADPARRARGGPFRKTFAEKEERTPEKPAGVRMEGRASRFSTPDFPDRGVAVRRALRRDARKGPGRAPRRDCRSSGDVRR